MGRMTRLSKGMENMKRVTIILLFVLSLVTGALARQDSTSYRLRPFDIIHVQVYNEQQVNAVLTVGPDGKVSYPFVHTIQTAGKTTAELEAELTPLYAKELHMVDPRVSVTIEQYRLIRATVGGSVLQPGMYDAFRPGDTLLSLLSRGGGANPLTADLHRATLRHANSREVIPIDLYGMLIKADMSQNYELEDGDELIVPEIQQPLVYVLGAVAQPGPVPYKEPMFLASAIAQARGGIPIKSKLSEVLVIRQNPLQPGQYMTIKTNFVRFVKSGDSSQNIAILPGDLVYVSETKTPDLNLLGNLFNTIFVFQDVFRNGLFGFKLFQ